MSQSFVQIYTHIVFHTKDKLKQIREDIENELFSYLGGILKNYKSTPLQIGGTSDHIHILCTLPKTMAVADLVEQIKKSSSKWIKTKGEHYKNFYWQDGYGGFSVIPVKFSTGIHSTNCQKSGHILSQIFNLA